MKSATLTSLLFMALFISSCREKPSNQINIVQKDEVVQKEQVVQKEAVVQNDTVIISYSRQINGYKVTIIYKPNMIRYKMAFGPAILNFKNKKTEFNISNNYLALPPELFDFDLNDNEITGIKTNKITIDYKEPNLENGLFENIYVPFAFIDLNFDGKKELLITETAQGQRFVDVFKVYSLKKGESGYDEYQINTDAPYDLIDFWSAIDKKNKELILYGSGGVCNNMYETYSLIKGKYSLTKIERQERDYNSKKCFVAVYAVHNGIEKLISKKEIEFD